MAQDDTDTILGALSMPVLIVDADRRVAHINPAASALFGPDLAGRHYATGLRQPLLHDAIAEALTARSGRTVRFFQTRQGRDTDYEAQVTPVELSGRRAAVVSLTDRTLVEEAIQIRRDFVANVSHELKTPLTAMAGFIETLLGAARDDPVARERFLGIMAREAERMNRLVQDLLSLSRVEEVERQRPMKPVNLAEILRMALARLRGLAEELGVEVDEEFASEKLTVPGDPDQLMQVFLNLIENGLKYGGSGGRLTLRLTRIDHDSVLRGPAVMAEVIDYGDGIASHHVPRLTERFYRVDDHRARGMGGTGLGLAIVKHIVNRHRGRFRIESQPGKGSRFSVILTEA